MGKEANLPCHKCPRHPSRKFISLVYLLLKLLVLAVSIVLVETTNAKMRFFRVPDLLAMAFTLAALGLVSTFLF